MCCSKMKTAKTPTKQPYKLQQQSQEAGYNARNHYMPSKSNLINSTLHVSTQLQI